VCTLDNHNSKNTVDSNNDEEIKEKLSVKFDDEQLKNVKFVMFKNDE
jgi:hypothetical protein